MATATQTNVTMSEKELVRYEYRPLLGIITSKTEVSRESLGTVIHIDSKIKPDEIYLNGEKIYPANQ